MLSGLDAVFSPRRVALVGASERPGSMGALFWRNLASFPGEVVPVTRTTARVGGVPAFASLREVPGPIDLAVVLVRAEAVPGVIADAAAREIPAAVVISGGFAETGPEGAALQERVVDLARRTGVRLVGPNCFGVQNCDLPLNASLAAGLPPGGGGIALVTQSGSYGMAVHTLATDERTRFAKVLALGNKADIGESEVLRYLSGDPASRTLCFLLESVPDGRRFCEAARAAGKPVIVTRTGRTAQGARAARSHTGALAGSDRVWRGAFEQCGVLVARSGLEMLDAARALDAQPVPAGDRVAVITNSGGTGVELADLLADAGLRVPELSASLRRELSALLPPFASTANPVDMTPVWRRFAELYPRLVRLLARSGEVDVVVPVLLQRAALDPEVAVGVRDAVADLRAQGNRVPVYACWVAPLEAHANAVLLQEGGVPCFPWPERSARAVGAAVRYRRIRQSAERRAARRAGAGDPPGRVAGHRRSLAGRDPGRLEPGWVDPDRGAALLRAANVPVVESFTCADAESAAAAAARVDGPVVCKVVHPDLPHRSDVGGVRVGLRAAAAVRTAAGELLGLAEGARVQVQPQIGGVETAVGGLRDPQFGPVVMVGVGGVFVEVLDDVVFGLAPLEPDEAVALIGRLRGAAVLRGARGAAPVDVAALADTVCAVGELLVAHPEITELDLNPVMVTAAGAVAVDWRIRVAGDPADDVGEPAGDGDGGRSGFSPGRTRNDG